jgi:UDP-N-acetyl-D-glucosamine dehydrogenase
MERRVGKSAEEQRRLLASERATVAVIGLGYVGLPLSLTMADAGKRVVGLDVDAAKVDRLARGESYIRHVSQDHVVARVGRVVVPAEIRDAPAGKIYPTTDFAALQACDAVIVCVPTPLTEGREPDLSYVESTARTISEHLQPSQLVVLESTTYPGTTDEVVRPILERCGGAVGRDFFLAFSPEREDPGNPRFSTRTIPKVVGGVTPDCGDVAAALYESFLERVVRVSSARVAESAKLLENIYRSINIALVNELKMLFERMGIDVWEVIDAAATKPFGFTPFYPGPGLGGHCIPIDPFYLTWKARHYDFSTRFIELAGEVNTAMPYWVVERTVAALNERRKALHGARVLVLGVAYKKDVDDLRESPSLKVIEILESRGAQVSYNDPYVPSLRAKRLRHYGTFALDSVPLTEERLAAADCVLVATDHGAYDYDWVVAHASLVVDTRNATRAVREGRDKIVKA